MPYKFFCCDCDKPFFLEYAPDTMQCPDCKILEAEATLETQLDQLEGTARWHEKVNTIPGLAETMERARASLEKK